MKCLRCSYCCTMYDVIIIAPNRVTVNLDLTDESVYMHKPTGFKCPHLTFVDGKAHCRIHQFSWFKDSPCDQFTQVENGDTNCRIGEYMLNKKNADIYKKVLNKPEFAEAKKKEKI